MKHFIGIDLGTTNSVISSYDGSDTRIWKSPEQNDVTPSAIYIDRRGNKYIGRKAYVSAPSNPDNCATLFKRLMGTSTPIRFPAVNMEKTPEECSAEILKVLFGYLPEEIRNNEEVGTVITVPAAFNQMQKNATMQAADMAGIGKVALMQEPVAAVMSVMKVRKTDGMFLIYDLGGGTLDVAIAESSGGRVSLLAHGGIAMCGGRDFDRAILDSVVRPWLKENFVLPEDFSVSPSFKKLIRLAAWAAEEAKIQLSSKEETMISLPESDIQTRDLDGNEIYLDIPLQRSLYDQLIAERIDESVNATREALEKAGLTSHDIERIVFIGGPTNYKPLRDKVSYELGINGSTEVNPMTAVAEGASLFAESIDWDSQERSRKNTRGQISSSGPMKLSFNYMARTPNSTAKIAVQLPEAVASGYEFQIDNLDTGHTSGRLPLVHGATVDVALPNSGANSFKVVVYDPTGRSVTLEQERIVITRTAATVEAIPASHSIGVEVREKDRTELVYLVRTGDALPKKGKTMFRADEAVKAGSHSELIFKLWEGEIEDIITDNRLIGVFKISGDDFYDGVIPAGAELECEYSMEDSGAIVINVSIPCIGAAFPSDRNFYSRQEGQIDYTSDASGVKEEGEHTLSRIEEIEEKIDDSRLEEVKEKLRSAISFDPNEADTEAIQEATEKNKEALRILAQVRKEHRREISQMDLDSAVDFFENVLRQHARPSEISAIEKLTKTAQRSIDRNDKDFDHHLSELQQRNTEILLRQDWFWVEHFKWLKKSPHLFINKRRFQELVAKGTQYMNLGDINNLRNIVRELSKIQIERTSNEEIFSAVNIRRG
jgi:molecular chaperone DnaK